MILFGDHVNKSLSERIGEELGLKVYYPDIHEFPDTEKRVRLLKEVVGEDVLIVKAFEPPVNSHVIEFAFLIDAAKRAGAKRVYGIAPYLAYQRADHIFRSGEAVPLEVVIKMLESTGLERILIVDPHTIKIPEMFSIPVDAQSALPLFADHIKTLSPDLSEVSVVSPDMGGIRRIKILSELLENASWVAVNKDRDYETGSTVATHHEGDIKKWCFIVDDMIASGGTAVEAVDYLLDRGAEHVYIMVTHPVFAKDAHEKLQNSKAEKIFVTDSLEVAQRQIFEKLEIISLAPLIARTIKEYLR